MSKHFYNGLRLGILGGGQLGRMLIQDAINYNVHISILDPDPNAPCKDIAAYFETGSLNDFDTVYAFGKKCDLLTIEIEHVNVDALEKLEKEGLTVYPQPQILRMIQDKGQQKIFYRLNNIPTADFFLVNDKAEISKHAADFPFMQKLRRGGYDGRGVTRLTDPAKLENAFDAPSVLEKFVDFQKEISVIVSRNAKGETKSFPTVELEFNPEANLVEFLFSPAGIPPNIEAEAQKIARTVAEKLGIVGLLAVEMFLTKGGKLLVNEIAPRPHNSGHQSIEGNFSSQYEQHLRAIFNQPPGSTAIIMPSVMINLLGEKGFEGDAVYEGMEEALQTEGVYIHLYGKKITKPFRKMGHVTILAQTMEEAKAKALKVKTTLKVKA
ncbi:MAG: 5-(carboxyamino)imidazole ribonucleotide synthase [Bacteroidetes bacterium]|nr:MAG: 5-(carboxyamino)imidazole ribonucleotide synthase [Bacteroidota bacterium]